MLLLVALPFMRPGVFGESLAGVGFALALSAGVLAFIEDRGRMNWSHGSWVIAILLGASQLWLVARLSDLNQPIQPVVQSAIILLLTISSASLVLSNRRRALFFWRGFIFISILLSASFVVTTILHILGFDAILFSFPVGTWTADLSVPFTPTTGTLTVGELGTLHRFTGFGREPGWMGMFLGVAFFAWRLIGGGHWVGYALMLAAMAGTLSTATFGAFVVVAAYEFFIRPRAYVDPLAAYLRQALGASLLVFAAWLAFTAPVLGYQAKQTLNETSYSERTTLLKAGIDALSRFSLGEDPTMPMQGISLVASVAIFGWPFFVLVSLAFLTPLALESEGGVRYAAPVLMMYLTLLLSQPPQDSTAVYVLLVACVALGTKKRSAESADMPACGPNADAPSLRRALQPMQIRGAANV